MISVDDVRKAKLILKQGLNVNAVWDYSELSLYPLTTRSTLLHWAAYYDAVKITEVSSLQGNTRNEASMPIRCWCTMEQMSVW